MSGISRRGQRRGTIGTRVDSTVEIGELIVAAFDVAAQYGTDPGEVSRLAAAAVMNVLTAAENARVVGLLAMGSIGKLPAPAALRIGLLPAEAGGGAGR